MTQKLKKIVSFLLLVITILLVLLLIKNVNNMIKAEKIDIIKDEFVYEYGTDISRNLEDYASNDKEILDKAKFYFDVRNEDGKDYPKVGTYTGLVDYDDLITSFKVIVKDTTVPQFTYIPSSINVDSGISMEELENNFSATDLSGASISINSDNLNLNVAGSYSVLVVASDPYDNSTSQSCIVNVIEKKGLANSGSYVDNDGNTVYFEEYYSLDEATNAQLSKMQNSEYVVSEVVESIYNGKTVYRYEWYSAADTVDIPESGLADSGTMTITDAETSQSVTANYESYFSYQEAEEAFNNYSNDTSFKVMDISEVNYLYKGQEVTVYQVVWYTKPSVDPTPDPEPTPDPNPGDNNGNN